MAMVVVVGIRLGSDDSGSDSHLGSNEQRHIPILGALHTLFIVLGAEHVQVDGFLLLGVECRSLHPRRLEEHILVAVVLHIEVDGVVMSLLFGLLHVGGEHQAFVGDVLHRFDVGEVESLLFYRVVLHPFVVVDERSRVCGVDLDFIEVQRP